MDSPNNDSDKENAIPGPAPCATKPIFTTSPQRHRPTYSPAGAHISKPPRRPGSTLRAILSETPSRPSYHMQMTRHWTSPKWYRPRSASPRRVPAAGQRISEKQDHRCLSPDDGRGAVQSGHGHLLTDPARHPQYGTNEDDVHAIFNCRQIDQSAATAASGSPDSTTSGGGVPIHYQSPVNPTETNAALKLQTFIPSGYKYSTGIRASRASATSGRHVRSQPNESAACNSEVTMAIGTTTSLPASTPSGGAILSPSISASDDPEDATPLNDVEAAVAQCFRHSPSPLSREERRKTLCIDVAARSTVRRGEHSPVTLAATFGHRVQKSSGYLGSSPSSSSSCSSSSSSSSEAWTGDEVFLPKAGSAHSHPLSQPPASLRVQQEQMLASSRMLQQQLGVQLPSPGAAPSRPALRQRMDSGVQLFSAPPKSRFRTCDSRVQSETDGSTTAQRVRSAQALVLQTLLMDQIPLRPASDADDEDEDEEDEGSGSEGSRGDSDRSRAV